MKFAIRPLSLLITLAVCSLAMSAITPPRSDTGSAPLSEVQAVAVSNGDPSVPAASTVRLQTDGETSAPTF